LNKTINRRWLASGGFFYCIVSDGGSPISKLQSRLSRSIDLAWLWTGEGPRGPSPELPVATTASAPCHTLSEVVKFVFDPAEGRVKFGWSLYCEER